MALSSEADSTPAVLRNVKNASLADTSHLCESCKRMDRVIRQMCEDKRSSIPRPFRTKKMVEECSSTCALCKLILDNSTWSHSSSNSDDLFISSDYYLNDGITTLNITSDTELFELPVQLSILTNEGSPSAVAGHVSGRCVKPASNFDCAKRWLKDCLENHVHGSNTDESRPSRLVAVGGEYYPPIFLVDGSTINEDYVALSHCWGMGETLRTTKENLSSFQDSIPWNQLPKTFRDALQVARGLGIGYIWIDSLCIIQDDIVDWGTESAKMAGVYNNALLTIMAASASDSRDGCFLSGISEHEMVALPYTDNDGATSLSVFASIPSPGYDDVVLRGPLFKRAWVFQERLLSKRKLILALIKCTGTVMVQYSPNLSFMVTAQP
ncbi:hypothetical protein LSUE1_G007579 [Lachnellula suecica]|uniref:Heterokaryon incompatibility domain-containing protein n=1 Tax=Lachnellula suecica TaxID=602035 RepID=A0A8T9C2Q8_9HELO|nr:hypothetical protein LSUE1_G007579 [Lachnellula suecica]